MSAQIIPFPSRVQTIDDRRDGWMNRMNIDRRLNAASFKFGCVIGIYFRENETPKLISRVELSATCARSVSTIDRHIRQLERCGYLRVQRRNTAYIKIEILFDKPQPAAQ